MNVHAKVNIDRFTGFADCYDDVRPQPPIAVTDLLAQLAGVERPSLVVDIGSGTGLSTRIWAGRADRVVGIEPNPDMRAEAERHTASNVTYREGVSTATGLPDGCADIVTCVQSLHWMEPEPTFAEIARILRPGGVFAAIDCDWPPLVHCELDAAYAACSQQIEALQKQKGVDDTVKRWAKSEHLARIRDSGRFRYVREIAMHQIDSGNAKRFMGIKLSQGRVRDLMKSGVTQHEMGIDRLGEVAGRLLGDRTVPWYYTYRLRLGVK
jgi:SAM-dependent methyltransferase